MLSQSSHSDFDANHASLVIFVDRGIGPVRFQLDPSPLGIECLELTEGTPPVRDWDIAFVQQVDIQAQLFFILWILSCEDRVEVLW